MHSRAVLDQREDHPARDPVGRPPDPGGGELLLDHQLLHRSGVPAPRLRPVRHHVASLDHRLAPGVLAEVANPPDELADDFADRLGLGRQVDRALPPDTLPEGVGDLYGRGLGVDDRLDGRSPPQVQMRVMLPGEPDPAVHLDVQVRILVRRGQCQGGCDRRGVGELITAAGAGARRVPDRRRRELGRDEHVGAVMFHRLEHANRTAELLAYLGVFGGHLGTCARHSCGLSGQHCPGEVGQHLPSAWHDLGRRSVERHPGAPARRVEISGHLHRHAAITAVHDRDVIAGRDNQHVGKMAA